MKAAPFFIGAATLGIIGWALWPKKAMAATPARPATGTKPTAADADMVIDSATGQGAVVTVPPVPVEAVQVEASAKAPAVAVGPGKITVPIPGNVSVLPVEPTAGETVILPELGAKTPDFVPPLPTTVFPGDTAPAVDSIPTDVLDQIVIETPAMSASADSLNASAAATLPGVVNAAAQIIQTALGGVNLPGPKAPPADSVALLQELLADEGKRGWKKVKASVKAWQSSRNLKVDGKFGRLSSAQMFAECGFTALVRYWPTTETLADAMANYAAAIQQIAQSRGTTAAAAAVLGREKGQGYATNPPAVQETATWAP